MNPCLMFPSGKKTTNVTFGFLLLLSLNYAVQLSAMANYVVDVQNLHILYTSKKMMIVTFYYPSLTAKVYL